MDIFKKLLYWHFYLAISLLVAITKDHVSSFIVPLGVSKKYAERISDPEPLDIVYPRLRHLSRKKRSYSSASEEEQLENNLLDNGGKTDKDDDVLVVFRGANRTFYMELQPTLDFLSDNLTFEHASGIFRERTPLSKSCHYRGKVISGTGGSVALNLCHPDGKMSGMIVTPEGRYTIQPDTDGSVLERSKNDTKGRHVFMKSAQKESFCGVKTIDGDIEPVLGEELHRKRRDVEGIKVIQIAVFTDSELYERVQKKHPKDTETKIKDLVMTIINQVQLIYNYESMRTKFKIVLEKLRILKPNEDAPDKANADIDLYLDTFCAWQAELAPAENEEGHWDHSIMLTGLNLYKEYEGVKNDKVLGLAWVNGMCRPNYSCTINEGQDFEASYVIAHEMAHSLGVLHDGTSNPCDPDTFIMSDKTGPGKISWSSCSNRYLEKYFNRGQAMCLENDVTPRPELDYVKATKLPGEKYVPTEQCKMAMGDDYKPYTTKKKPFNNICRELWCFTGTWATPAHPALDGSSCNPGMLCKQGDCVRDSRETLTPRKEQASGDEEPSDDSSSGGNCCRETKEDSEDKPGVMDRVSGFFKDVFRRVRNFFRTVG